MGLLGEFLRSRRERMSPQSFGIAVGGRRRTPGLRREEVAERAQISLGWYLELERGRLPRVTPRVLGALGDALALTTVERAFTLRLAGLPAALETAVRPGLFEAYVARDPSIGAALFDLQGGVISSDALMNVYLDLADGDVGACLKRIFVSGQEAWTRRCYGESLDRLRREVAEFVRFLYSAQPVVLQPLIDELIDEPAFGDLWQQFGVRSCSEITTFPRFLRDGSPIWLADHGIIELPAHRYLILCAFQADDVPHLRSLGVGDRYVAQAR